ncbi:MAG: response regulator [Gammaproteobacteria bacterium]|nr:response regulator [Gammaproteobacteria bacterium]
MENKNELRSEPKSRSTDATPQPPIPHSHSEILIVEDSAVEAEMLRRILVRAGYRVTLATNGKEGLQALREHPCALVISDVQMPLMDGYELCRTIKFDENLWSTPVVLVTMLSEPKDIIMALDVGADGYVTKPYVEDMLLGRVRSLLANPPRRKLAEERRKIHVEYGGEKHSISVDSPQMVNLLLSVYENTLTLNQELMLIQNQLNVLNESLDDQVRSRTAALQESEQKFRTATDTILDAFIIIDGGVQGTITWWNSAAEAMFGYSKQEAAGRALHELIVPPRFREEARHGLEHFNQTGEGTAINKTVELVALHKNGTEFPIELSLSAMQRNGKWQAIGIVRDITERKLVESQLNEQLDELRRWHEATLGREVRTLELKREVNELLVQAGQQPRYTSV